MGSSIWILIVEDRPTDRELLRYAIEDKFQQEAHFREADTLEQAIGYLHQQPFDCVILDLSLPDSKGRETFREVNARFPHIPIIIMTHNKDRDLALSMIREGAADYILKNFTDAEDLFRRVQFAIEKHNRSIRMSPENVSSIRKMERAKANMLDAHQSGQHSAVREMTVETTSALADLSRRQFTELQSLSNKMGQFATQLATMDSLAKTVDNLDREILRGHSGRPSMRSEVELMKHQVVENKNDILSLQERMKKESEARDQQEVELKKHRMSNRTKILLGILTLLGVLAGAIVSYETAKASKHDDPKGESK